MTTRGALARENARMPHRLRLAALLALAATAAHAAETSYDTMLANARKDCVKAAPAYPAKDRSPPPAPHCSATNAYYGIGEPVNDARARACAYAGDDFDVLAMLYANGRGVPRNIAVARRAVCDDDDAAPAETSGRLEHLARIEARPAPFDYCDDATSGRMEGSCAMLRTTITQQQRERDIAARTASWTPASKAALATLRRAMEAFVKARDGEVDLSGTARGAMLVAAEDEVREQYAALLERAEAGKLADAPPSAAKAADERLNAAWKKVRALRPSDLGTVRQEDLVVVQRAWLRYRDAWVAFGRQRYPAITADTWVATLTDARTKQLKELSGDAD